ncbi:DNA double-strand break repair Rad50 ATPase-like, partial [Trifolium medium]|nr:DNA double-strand break repair Rad50 ATPase-like [Trifolium medium]
IQIGELEERVKNHLATITELGEENSKLADKKQAVETKYRELQERVSKLKEVTKLLMNVDASSDGNNEREPHADPMVADFEDLPVEDARVNVFGHDTVEAAPLRRNEYVHDSFRVAASTQPQNIGGNNAQGASSGILEIMHAFNYFL